MTIQIISGGGVIHRLGWSTFDRALPSAVINSGNRISPKPRGCSEDALERAASWTAVAGHRFGVRSVDAYHFCQGISGQGNCQGNNRAMCEPRTPWPHAPTHQLSRTGTYFVTASTYEHAHHFRSAKRLGVLQRGLLGIAFDYGWRLEAWAIFSNHYHFVVHSPENAEDASTLSTMLNVLHSRTSEWINGQDDAPGRQVWFNFRETRLTFQRSYLARLNYVHQNAVHHRLVPVANQYPWCSAAWFERSVSTAMVKSIYRFKVDQVQVYDPFQPEWNDELKEQEKSKRGERASGKQ